MKMMKRLGLRISYFVVFFSSLRRCFFDKTDIDAASFHAWIHLSKFWPVGEGGLGRLGCSWSVTKSVTKQKAKPEKFFSENFVLSRNQETSVWILTRATPLVAPNLVILRQNETQRQCLGLPSLPY